MREISTGEMAQHIVPESKNLGRRPEEKENSRGTVDGASRTDIETCDTEKFTRYRLNLRGDQ